MNGGSTPVDAARIAQAHARYCQLTGQSLSLGFDRERLWYELLRRGVNLEQVERLIGYLQREIRAGRRNVGALKLSNLLQPDRFEEDLALSQVKLHSPPRSGAPADRPAPPLAPQLQAQGRQRALELLRQLRASLR
jgi:hypothetical protein